VEHHFVPDTYHHTLGSHPPVLTVRSGDSVVTTTLDAYGEDFRGDRVTD
jgi:amidase